MLHPGEELVQKSPRKAEPARWGASAASQRARSNISRGGGTCASLLPARRSPISLRRGVKYILGSGTSESKQTHTPEDNPVTHILPDGGAEEFGRERTPDPAGSAFTGLQLLHFPCLQEASGRTQARPNLVSFSWLSWCPRICSCLLLIR